MVNAARATNRFLILANTLSVSARQKESPVSEFCGSSLHDVPLICLFLYLLHRIDFIIEKGMKKGRWVREQRPTGLAGTINRF